MNIQTRGLKELIDKVTKLGLNSDLILQEGLLKGGLKVQGDAKLLCPVDEGRLRASIETTQIEKGVIVGTNVEYAVFVEYGTGLKGNPEIAHTTKEKWVYKKGDRFYTSHGQSPQPFLHPALNKNKYYIVEMIRNKFKKALERG